MFAYTTDSPDPGDVELLEAAGVPEFPTDEPTRVEIEQHALMQGATREDIADLEDGALIEKYGGPR